MREMNIAKLALRDANNDAEKDLLMTWALPCETMLLSNMYDTINRTIIILPDAREKQFNPSGNFQEFIDPFFVIPIKKMNTGYFTMDTTEPYTLSSWENFDR